MKGADFILELIFKGLLQWLFDMIINITEYLANSLLTIFSMDLSYFESAVPITGDIVNIMLCVGWALLLGNLVFQAMKTMMTGLGFEGEAPQTLFGRTFVMSFLLIGSRQVCDIGLGITKKVIDWLQVPTIVQVPQLAESTFTVPGDASWLLVIIVGIILVSQIIKLFFEIGERYVIVAILTILSPLAFAMGGSKNTSDIFKGWVRMFASMCLMMILSIVFLKFILSALSVVPTGVAVIPWCVFIVAIARTGRKIDGIIARVGLNPAVTGDPLSHSRMPGMLSYMVIKNMAGSIGKTAGESKSGAGKSGTGASKPALASGASSHGAGSTPVRPPIGSSASASTSSSTGAASPTVASTGSLSSPTTAKPSDATPYKETSHTPTLTSGSVGTAGSPYGDGTSGKTTARPPIASPASTDSLASAKSTSTGAHEAGASGKPTVKPSITSTASTASTDKSSATKPAYTGTHGAVTPEKVTVARPSTESTHGTTGADKARPTTARPAAASVSGTASHDKPSSATGLAATKDVSSSGGKIAARTLESSTSSTVNSKGHSTEAPRAATPIAARPTADIKTADTAKAGTSSSDTPAKTGIPPAASARAGMPLTDKIRPTSSSTDKTAGAIASRGESVKTAKDSHSQAGKSARPTTPVIESGKATSMRPAHPTTGATGARAATGTPKPSGASGKSPIESRPSDGSVLNKSGDVNQKGGNVSQSQTNASNVTLQQKATLPKRNSPEVTTARGEQSRPPVGKIPNTSKTGGASSSKPAVSGEAAKSATNLNGNAVSALHNQSTSEQNTSGGLKESYRGASTRPDSKTSRNNEKVKPSGTAGQTVNTAGANVSTKATGTAGTTSNAGAANTILAQTGISTSKPPSVSQGAPSRPTTTARSSGTNNAYVTGDMGKPVQAQKVSETASHMSGKDRKQPQMSTGTNNENNERLKSRPTYKPSGDKKPDGKKRGNV